MMIHYIGNLPLVPTHINGKEVRKVFSSKNLLLPVSKIVLMCLHRRRVNFNSVI